SFGSQRAEGNPGSDFGYEVWIAELEPCSRNGKRISACASSRVADRDAKLDSTHNSRSRAAGDSSGISGIEWPTTLGAGAYQSRPARSVQRLLALFRAALRFVATRLDG